VAGGFGSVRPLDAIFLDHRWRFVTLSEIAIATDCNP
jgi:hypothetical protein